MSTKFTSKGLKKDGPDTRRLSSLLTDLLQSAYDARRGLKDRWELNEKVYRNDPSIAGVRLFDNFEPRALPTMSPRIKRIVNQTIASIEGPGTWFQAVPDDGDADYAEGLEKAVQICLERSKFIRTLRRALTTASLCGVSVLRARMSEYGLVIEHIHPNDFVVSPTYGLDLMDAHLCGHRFYVPRWKVEERVKNGLYDLVDDKTAKRASATDPDDDPSGRDPDYDNSLADARTTHGEWELVELWELIVRLEIDGKPGMYRIVYSDQDRQLYQLEAYPYDRPWYFDMRFHDEEGKWWPSTSVAQDIVGICLQKSEMMNLMAAGSMATVANPVVVSGGSLGKKLKSLSLNQIYETPYPVQVQEIPLRFDPKAMPLVLQYIDQSIEAQTGVSDNRLNANSFQGERVTAREVSAIEQAASQNEGSYAEFLANLVEQVAAFVQQLMWRHPSAFQNSYPSIDPLLIKNAKRPVRWQVTGHTASNAPNIVLGKLQAMLSLAAQPMSAYSYERVEKAVVQAMVLPMNTQKLEKTPEELAQQAQAMAQAQALAAATGEGQPSNDGGLAPGSGMGLPA